MIQDVRSLPMYPTALCFEAKFWLNPDIHLAYNDGFGARDLRELFKLVEQNRIRIEETWHGFFGQGHHHSF